MTRHTETIDRLAPTVRPAARPVGSQRWRDLLFLHWLVDVDRLQSMLPPSLTADCYDGRAYLGIVPFAMRDVRPWRWAPQWAASNFLECNLRTYVVCNGRPGVYFFSLDAASRLAVWAARTFWGLPYFSAAMQMKRRDREIEYTVMRSGTDHRHSCRYRVGAELGASELGTIEHFLLERYLLFVDRRGQIQVGQVHHRPYPVYRVNLLSCDDDLKEAAGFDGISGLPAWQHYSPGVDVEVYGLCSMPSTLVAHAVNRTR